MVAGLVAVIPLWAHFSTTTGRPGQQEPPTTRMSDQATAVAQDFPAFHDVVPVLAYHRINDHGGPYDITADQFDRHMAALKAAGFQTVTLETVRTTATGQRPKLPPRPVLITFDDGSFDNYTVADRILAKHDFTAVAFLITGRVVDSERSSSTVNAREVRAMADSGRWEFGGHTHDLHRRIATTGVPNAPSEGVPALINRQTVNGARESFAAWRSRTEADFAASQKRITELLGRPAIALAYPYGAAGLPTNDDRIPAALDAISRKNGYSIGFVSGDAYTAADVTRLTPVAAGDDVLRLHRMGVSGRMDDTRLLTTIAAALPSPIPSTLAGTTWTSRDGTCRRDGAGDVTVTPRETYASCRLDLRARQWRDYSLTTTVSGIGQCSAFVAVRESHSGETVEQGRVEAALGSGIFRLAEEIGGTERDLGSAAGSFADPTMVTLRVHGDGVTATARGITLTGKGLRRNGGSIAFSAWCPAGHGPVTFSATRLHRLPAR